MYSSLSELRSPLKDQQLVPGEPVGPPATRRVIFVLIDGLRYDTSMDSTIMPTLAELRQAGASAKVHSRSPSYSQPGYSTLMTGAWPGVNDGPVMNHDYESMPAWTQDNLFSAVSRAGMRTAVSAYYWFEKLIPDGDTSVSYYSPDGDYMSDRSVVDTALGWLENPQDYQFVLIHLSQVDRAGHHEGRPRSEKWVAAARRVDELVGEIVQKLDLTQDTIVVSSDHGHIDRGGHGGADPAAMTEPFVLAGANVQPGAYDDLQMVDLAPTIAALLGVNIPASNQGQVQTAMLVLPAATLGNLPAALSTQQEQMVSAYASGIGETMFSPATRDVTGWQTVLEEIRSIRLARERLWRGAFSLLVLVILLRLTSRKNWHKAYWRQYAWPAACAAIYLLVFNLRYAVMDGRTYSLSSVPGPYWLIEYAGITTAFALFLSWLIYVWRANLLRCIPVEAAGETLRFSFTVVGVLALPALVNFILNGAVVRWTVPEPSSFFLGMLALGQISFVPLIGLLLAALAAFTAWLLRLDQRRAVASSAETTIE